MSANHRADNATGLWKEFSNAARISFLLIAVIVVLRLPVNESLSLRDGIAAWITQDNLFSALSRAGQSQISSPLYYILEWGVQLILGSSEFALRFLSLMGAAGAALFLFLISRKLGGAEFGWLSCAAFISLTPVLEAALTADPSALALATALASMWLLLKWEEDGRYRYSIPYLFMFLASVYLQYLVAFLLIIHILHFAIFFHRQQIRLVSFLMELLLAAALLVPAAFHIVTLSDRQPLLQLAPPAGAADLVSLLVSPIHLTAVFAAIACTLVWTRDRSMSMRLEGKVIAWIGTWLVIPPAAFFLASKFGQVSIFSERFLLFCAPALAMSIAGALLVFPDRNRTRVAVAVFAVCVALREAVRIWEIQNWKGAALAINSDPHPHPVFVFTGTIADKDLAGAFGETREQYLVSPLLYYGVTNLLIPSQITTEDRIEPEAGTALAQKLYASIKEGYVLVLKERGATPGAVTSHFRERGFLVTKRGLPGGDSVLELFEAAKIEAGAGPPHIKDLSTGPVVPTQPPQQPSQAADEI